MSRSKGNQTVKFGQLIDYNMRNIFLQKSYTKCGAHTNPWHFFEKWKLSISLGQLAKVWDSLFLLYAKLRAIPLAFTSYEAFFKKQKEIRDLSPYLIFCIIFDKKYFCWYALLIDEVSLSSCLYFERYCAICITVC